MQLRQKLVRGYRCASRDRNDRGTRFLRLLQVDGKESRPLLQRWWKVGELGV